MKKAILGKKIGMTQMFTENGNVIPVTVVVAGPCPVMQVKTLAKDGYEAVKVGFDAIRENSVNKPMAGQFKASKTPATRYQREFRFENCADYTVGESVITADIFTVGDHVDVVGTTKGRGFTGTIQRWNTHCGPMAHGSGYHRGVGSLGANSTPSRVFKNKKMPGHYGSERVTIQNLEIVKVDAERNVILIAGGIPGAKNSLVTVTETLKKATNKSWLKTATKAPAKKG
ncbi:MAG: 50S ribosomal protein L3 [Bacillota bacterium]